MVSFQQLGIPSRDLLTHRKGGRVNGKLLEREMGWKINNQKKRYSMLEILEWGLGNQAQQTHVDFYPQKVKGEERKKKRKEEREGGRKEITII